MWAEITDIPFAYVIEKLNKIRDEEGTTMTCLNLTSKQAALLLDILQNAATGRSFSIHVESTKNQLKDILFQLYDIFASKVD